MQIYTVFKSPITFKQAKVTDIWQYECLLKQVKNHPLFTILLPI